MSFTIKFTGNHLDMFWHHVGERTESSHGLIGKYFVYKSQSIQHYTDCLITTVMSSKIAILLPKACVFCGLCGEET